MKGFTLFELLIAMLLTAIIGTVMFRTWDLVIQSGAGAQKAVAGRERERIVFGIIDNDMAALVIGEGENQTLPRLSRNAILPDDAFYEAMDRKKENQLPRGTTVLLSFATGSGLNPDSSGLGFPVCVEYLLRQEAGSGHALVRRERDYCGVSGDFPWSEAMLLDNLQQASIELLFRDGTSLARWTDNDLNQQPIAVRLLWKKNGGREEEALFPVFARREEIGWEDGKS